VKDVVETGFNNSEMLYILVGMIAAAASGYLAITFMLNFVKKKGLKIFAIYVLVLGILVLADQIFFHRFFDTFLWMHFNK
jgi:undecaprenyl-diphosphatase